MIRAGILIIFLSLTACSADIKEPLTVPGAEKHIARGRELTLGLASCGFCHGIEPSPASPLAGGRAFFDSYGEVRAPNITVSESGIGSWNPNELITAFRGNLGKDERLLSTEVHAGFEWISDNDLISIIAYIQSLPPIDNEVSRRELSFYQRNTTGMFEKRRTVEGYVPDFDPRHAVQYGQYLVDHVARCASCHSSPATLLTSSVYLGGGEIQTERGKKAAPNLTGALNYGLGAWDEKDIVGYLRTGNRPDGSSVDPAFCPVGFYRNASETDLFAIAKYLKSLS